MTKVKFTIVGASIDGARACIVVEAQEPWTPLDVCDIGKMENFIPDVLYQVIISDDVGSREFTTKGVASINGADWSRRKRPIGQDISIMDVG